MTLRIVLCLYSFAPNSFSASCLNSFFWIFPFPFLGILSTNLIPPFSCLYPASLSLVNALISSSVTLAFGRATTYARGSSDSSIDRCTPITAQSTMLGCRRSTPSSSVGATWKPLTLMSSCYAVSQTRLLTASFKAWTNLLSINDIPLPSLHITVANVSRMEISLVIPVSFVGFLVFIITFYNDRTPHT